MQPVTEWEISDDIEAYQLHQKIIELAAELECKTIHVDSQQPYTVGMLRDILKVLEMIRDK